MECVRIRKGKEKKMKQKRGLRKINSGHFSSQGEKVRLQSNGFGFQMIHYSAVAKMEESH